MSSSPDSLLAHDENATDFICRQAIYDRAQELAGYELLYRHGDSSSNPGHDSALSTARLLANSLLEIGFDRLVGNTPAFINCPREWILDDRIRMLDKTRVVLEILEDVTPDADVVDSVRRLVDEGYRIALDDFQFTENHRPLVELAHIIKLDVRAFSPAALLQELKLLKNAGNARLLAEKVETAQEFEACKQAGFELFQGYFLSVPRIVENSNLPLNQLAVVKLLAKLNQPEASPAEIAELVREDATLSVRLLQFCNSASLGLRHQIRSIDQAVRLLGINRIRQMATLVSMRSLGRVHASVLSLALFRSTLCEILAEESGLSPSTGHLVGLMSSLALIMEMPLENILQSLPLHPDVLDAVLRQTGPYGQILDCTQAVERSDLPRIQCNNLSPRRLQLAYLQAIEKHNLTNTPP